MTTAKKLKKSIEFTEGKIFSKIIVFILPIIATSFLQVFYNVADMMIVGLSPDQDAVGAVGITSPIVSMVLQLITGASIGANVVISKNLGAKNKDEVQKAVHTSFAFMLILGVCSLVLGLILARPILKLMGGRENFLDLAVRYVSVYFLGAPFSAITNWGTVVLRSKGNNKTALKILSVSGLFNVAMNFLFVLVFNMSVEGVAIATMLSNVLSAILITVCLLREDSEIKFYFKKIRIYGDTLKRILRIGIPAALEGMVISLSDMMVQSALIRVNNLMSPIDSAYQPVIKGSVAHSSLEGFISPITGATASAITVFVAQNCGANKFDRVKSVMNIGYAIMFVASVGAVAILTLLRAPLLSLYGVVDGPVGSLEHIAYQTAMTKIKVVWFPFFIMTFSTVGSATLRGMGYSLNTTIINLSGVVAFRIIWINTIFNIYPTLEILLLCYPLSSLLMAVSFFICARVRLKKIKRMTA